MNTFAELFGAAVVGAVCFFWRMDGLRKAAEHERLMREQWKDFWKIRLTGHSESKHTPDCLISN
jgi:hypothetical protein